MVHDWVFANLNRLKNNSSAILIVAIITLVVVAAGLLIVPMFQPSTNLRLGDGVFAAHIASTPDTREQGLSGETSLDSSQALILAFPSDGQCQIWMKGMKIPIDIVWLNKDKRVVYMIENASPKDSTKVMFPPRVAARYVIELTAGTVQAKNIEVGRLGEFDVKLETVK